jgi:hypothetical protein
MYQFIFGLLLFGTTVVHAAPPSRSEISLEEIRVIQSVSLICLLKSDFFSESFESLSFIRSTPALCPMSMYSLKVWLSSLSSSTIRTSSEARFFLRS